MLKTNTGKNAIEERYDSVTLFEKPALFTCLRIDRASVPSGLYAYDIRHNDDGIAASVEETVMVNHMGTVILSEPLDFGESDYIPLDDEEGDFNFTGEGYSSIDEYRQYLSDSEHIQGESSPKMSM